MRQLTLPFALSILIKGTNQSWFRIATCQHFQRFASWATCRSVPRSGWRTRIFWIAFPPEPVLHTGGLLSQLASVCGGQKIGHFLTYTPLMRDANSLAATSFFVCAYYHLNQLPLHWAACSRLLDLRKRKEAFGWAACFEHYSKLESQRISTEILLDHVCCSCTSCCDCVFAKKNW